MFALWFTHICQISILCVFVRVLKLLFSGPHNIVKHTESHGQFFLTWTPSDSEDEENHPICFVVQAELKSDGLNIFAPPFLWIYVVLFHFLITFFGFLLSVQPSITLSYAVWLWAFKLVSKLQKCTFPSMISVTVYFNIFVYYIFRTNHHSSANNCSAFNHPRTYNQSSVQYVKYRGADADHEYCQRPVSWWQFKLLLLVINYNQWHKDG